MFGQAAPSVGEAPSVDRHDADASLPGGAVPAAPGITSSRNRSGLDEDYKFTPRLFVPTIADGPKPTDIQRCLDGMRIVCRDVDGDFVDSEGNYIRIPRRDGDDPSSKQVLGLPYARVFWEMARGNLLLGVDGKTMYRRDRDDTGANAKLTGFHAIADLREGFGIDSKQAIKSMDRLARIMLASQAGRVQHGVRFGDCAFLRDRTGTLDVGTVKRIGPDDDRFAQPFEVSFDCGFDQKLADQARDWLKFVTAGEHSAMNLARMFACPLLEPFKSLSFLCYGQGGNGKGLLASALMSDPVTSSLAVGVDAHSLLGGPGVSQFATQQAAFRIIGTLWAIDQDADTVRLEQMTNLKKISTGDQQVGRLIGENSVVFAPRCTLVLMTNNPVIMPDTEALRRRQVSIRMQEGHTREQFLPLVRFIREHGAAPFMMVSCQLWEQHGDAPFTDVEIGDAATLTDHEQWIVDEIVKHGYAVTGENPLQGFGRRAPELGRQARTGLQGQEDPGQARANPHGRQPEEVPSLRERVRIGHGRRRTRI